MKGEKDRKVRDGAALFVVLIVVMAITVLSLSFLSRSDVELACGNNMALRSQMDYLADSALEHARGLILTPQDVVSEHWTGAEGQQLVAGSDDYYDVSVTKIAECNYRVTCEAYRQKDGQKIGRSGLTAEVRLDPCIAYWQPDNHAIPWSVTIDGDVYCGDNLGIAGIINGDVYAAGDVTVSGFVLGRINRFVSTAPVSVPGLAYSDFSSHYHIGPTQYSVGIIPPGSWLVNTTLGPTVANPAGIYYCDGSLNFGGNVVIEGTLVVKDDLRLNQYCDVKVAATKGFPAIIVGHDIRAEDIYADLTVTGLVQVDHHIDMRNELGSDISILGALYVLGGGGGIKDTGGCSVDITGSPDKAAIEVWSDAHTVRRWSPAAGAFYKNVQRQ